MFRLARLVRAFAYLAKANSTQKALLIRQKKTVTPLPTIKKRSQFLALRKGPRFHCEAFVLQGNLEAKDAALPHVGFTVTKKIGNAVERNRIRRRLRQAVAQAVHSKLATSSALDRSKAPHGGISGEMVVVARHSAIDESYLSLVNKFTKGIDRLLAKGKKAG